MPNQRFHTVFAKDGRPLVHARPSATVAPFPVTADATENTVTSPLQEGAILVFSTVDFHIRMDGVAATTADMRYEGLKVHIISVKSGDQPSIIGNTSANVHVHLVSD